MRHQHILGQKIALVETEGFSSGQIIKESGILCEEVFIFNMCKWETSEWRKWMSDVIKFAF